MKREEVIDALQGFWERQRQRALKREDRQAEYWEQQKRRVKLGTAGTIRPQQRQKRSA